MILEYKIEITPAEFEETIEKVFKLLKKLNDTSTEKPEEKDKKKKG